MALKRHGSEHTGEQREAQSLVRGAGRQSGETQVRVRKSPERRCRLDGAHVRGSICGNTSMSKPTGTDNGLIKNVMNIDEVFTMCYMLIYNIE